MNFAGRLQCRPGFRLASSRRFNENQILPLVRSFEQDE
jgi:hypothetical protein